jgi:hypothetical protein
MQMGMIAVLHTWGQQLSLHPHLHCIVPGGGINRDGQWKNTRTDGKFLFPVKLCQSFRAKYCAKLKAKSPINTNKSGRIYGKTWVVLLRNLWKYKVGGGIFGRYTHKIAIATRELKVLMLKVTLITKITEVAGAKKMTLTHQKFIRFLRCIFCPNVL